MFQLRKPKVLILPFLLSWISVWAHPIAWSSWPVSVLNVFEVWYLFCSDKIPQTVEIQTKSVLIEEKAVKLRLTVVDTPGFGDMLDNTDWFVLVQ